MDFFERTGVEVEWYDGFVNDPQLVVYADFDYEEKYDRLFGQFVYEKRPAGLGNIYYSEYRGLVDYVYYAGPSDGFGGRTFELKMKDGSVEKLKGPWKGSPSSVVHAGFPPCLDIVVARNIHSRVGSAGTIPLIKDLVKEYNSKEENKRKAVLVNAVSRVNPSREEWFLAERANFKEDHNSGSPGFIFKGASCKGPNYTSDHSFVIYSGE